MFQSDINIPGASYIPRPTTEEAEYLATPCASGYRKIIASLSWADLAVEAIFLDADVAALHQEIGRLHAEIALLTSEAVA